MDNNVKLSVQDLTVSFKTVNGLVRAVRGVSFDLVEGETLAIVGESGSGKSVTSRTIMGILAGNGVIDKGRIIYENEDLTKVGEEHFHELRGNKIGMIFQDPMSSLNPIMKIGKQISEGMILNGKHLKSKYKALVHDEKVKVEKLKRAKKTLRVEYRGQRKTDEPTFSKVEFKKDLNAIKRDLVIARKALKSARPSARKEVDLFWKTAKQGVKAEIASVKNNSNDKKEIAKEISELKEKLARIKNVTKKEAQERTIKIMTEVGIPEPEKRSRQYPFQFSGGMRQRIVIAIALTANPDVIICDEPTTALDVTIQAQILELINSLKKEKNLTVIFITHDLGVVANMADRIAVMYAGKIVEIGTAEEVFYNPRHPYTWALLSSMPDLTSKGRLSAIPGTPPNMIFPPKGDAFAARNSYSMKIDFEEEPPFFQISPTHYAATWLLHDDAPKIEIPEEITSRIKRMQEMTSEVSIDGE